MTMHCRHCGGVVVWKGPLSALTHTECTQCGATNSQLPDEPAHDADTDRLRELVDERAEEFVARTMASITAVLSEHTKTVAQFAVHMHDRVRRAEAVADALANSTCTFDADNDRITFSNASAVLALLNIYRTHKKG